MLKAFKFGGVVESGITESGVQESGIVESKPSCHLVEKSNFVRTPSKRERQQAFVEKVKYSSYL